MSRHYNPSKNDDALKRYEDQTYRCYEVFERQLKKSDGKSVIPGGITAVDCHFEPWVRLYEKAGLSLDKYPNVAKWLKNFGETKEVEAAYKKIQDASS